MKTAEEIFEKHSKNWTKHQHNGNWYPKQMAIEAMEEYASQPKWISVEEPPEIKYDNDGDGQSDFVNVIAGKSRTIYLASFNGQHWHRRHGRKVLNVIEWQPITPPTK